MNNEKRKITKKDNDYQLGRVEGYEITFRMFWEVIGLNEWLICTHGVKM